MDLATTAGWHSYDNAVVNQDAYQGVQPSFTLTPEVLNLVEYKNKRAGQQGLSDHSPIIRTLKEIRRPPRQNDADRAAAHRDGRAGPASNPAAAT